MPRTAILAAYTGPDETADALALGRLLADLARGDLALAHPMRRGNRHEDRGEQRRRREGMTRVRDDLAAAAPMAGDFDILPLAGGDLVRGVHDLCTSEGAGLLVVGTKRRRGAGRVLSTIAEQLVPRARCPVVVAPPGFRLRSAISPGVVGIAFDGSIASSPALDLGLDLARVLGAQARVLGVREPGEELSPAQVAVRAISGALPRNAEPWLLEGEPGAVLAGTTDGMVGVLVMGAPKRSDVVAQVLASARVPVILCPPRIPAPADLFPEPQPIQPEPAPAPAPAPGGAMLRRTLHLDWGKKPKKPQRTDTPPLSRRVA